MCSRNARRAAGAHAAITRAAPVRPPPPPPPQAAAARTALRVPEAGDRSGTGHRARRPRDADRAHPQHRHVRLRQRHAWRPATIRLLERIGEALKAEKGPVHGRRLHRQPADPHRAVPVQLPAVHRRAPRRRARSSCDGARRCRAASPRRATRMPIRSPPTPRRKAATRTGASRSCCGGRARPCAPSFAFFGSRWFLSFIGVALLGVLVWLFGPFLSFLEDWIAARHHHRGDAADLGRA